MSLEDPNTIESPLVTWYRERDDTHGRLVKALERQAELLAVQNGSLDRQIESLERQIVLLDKQSTDLATVIESLERAVASAESLIKTQDQLIDNQNDLITSFEQILKANGIRGPGDHDAACKTKTLPS